MNVSSYTRRSFKRKMSHKIVKLKSYKYQIHSAKVVLFKMSKQYLGLRSYQSVNMPAIQSSVRLPLISYNLLTHVFIHEERAQGKRITDKILAQFSVIKTRDHLRQIAMIDSIEYCLEHNVNKSKNKTVKEIKNMLIAA